MTQANAPTKQQYDNLHVLMDVVDTVRHAKMDAERVAGEAMDDEALVEQVLRVYQSQGMAVDEATVREGLELMKSRRFEFTAPRQSLATRLASIYITRDQWGPKVRGIAGMLAILIGVFVPASLFYQANQERNWMRAANATIQTQHHLETQTLQLSEQIGPLVLGEGPVANVASLAHEELTHAEGALNQLPSLPSTQEEREAIYEQDKEGARALINHRKEGLEAAQARIKAAQAHLHDSKIIQQAIQKAQVFEGPVPSHLENLRDLQKLAFERSLAGGDAPGMEAAISTLTQAVALDERREGLAGQVSSITGSDAQTLASALEEAKAALVVGNLSVATTLMDDTASKLEILPLSYTLRIVSEPGEKTGVWRYFDGDRSRRSHYIVVDAVDAAGQAVTLPIQSVEDNTITRTSRFAVRVPEHVYDAVGKDKTDNGIIDNPSFGYKRAGAMEPTYEFETLGGMITKW